MKKILLFIFLICIIPFASATLEVSPNVTYQTSTANFTFSETQNYNSIEFNDPNLIFTTTNGRQVALSSDKNASIKSITSNVNDVSVVINGSSATVVITAALDRANVLYEYFIDGIENTSVLSSASGIITKTVLTTKETTYRFYYEATAALDALVSNCQSTANTYSSTLQIFCLAVMILAFGFVFLQFKTMQSGTTEVNPKLIIAGILISVIALSILILGNYLIYALMGAGLCKQY